METNPFMRAELPDVQVHFSLTRLGF